MSTNRFVIGALFWLLHACTKDGENTGQADEVLPSDTGSASADAHSPLDATTYADPKVCGSCHPTHYAQWETSMHRYAARSPVFDAMAAKAFRDTSGEIGTFCTGCHSPIGKAEGELGWSVAADRSPKSREGVSCDYCHSVTGHTGILGNGNLVSAPTPVKYGPFGSDYDGAHTTQKSDFIQSSELCGSCHDVFIFPGAQIEQAYTEYTESPAAEAGVRCQDCHMGPIPGLPSARATGPAAIVDGKPWPDRVLSDHHFVGPDYALIDDFPYPDDLAASAEAQAAYLDQVQTLLSNAAKVEGLGVSFDPTQLGGTIGFTVRSLTTGHRIPTGFTSERQMWIAVTVEDREGKTVWASGDLDQFGDLRDVHSLDVETGAVALDTALVNFQSENVTNWRSWTDAGFFAEGGMSGSFLSVFPFDALAVVRYSLTPGEERTLVYPFEGVGPEDIGRVTVALQYRNLPPYLLRALQLDELVERLQIFTIDSVEMSFE